MPARNREFGFVCPAFSLASSASGFLLPRSHNALLPKSLLGAAKTAAVTGRYTLVVHCDGEVRCAAPVVVAWARHRSSAEPFLALKAPDPARLRAHLRALDGRDVELAFRPRAVNSPGR